MQKFLSVIEKALKRSGMSARSLSLKAGCGPSAIRDMRTGRAPSAERLRAICNVLGLELSIRARRAENDVVLSQDQVQRLRGTVRELTELVEELDELSRQRPRSPDD